MAQLSCCVKIEISSRQITAEFVVQVVQLCQFGSRCAGTLALISSQPSLHIVLGEALSWGAQDSCAGARRSSELDFELVRMRKKMHPFTGQHMNCQSFVVRMSLKMSVADRILRAQVRKKFPL